ncbi:MAG: hypothetical protein F6K30_27765 [Cyanothece sp. SIO2G6]|nr:hypothetical protein [Cyanothece sp. SIO2G6]
MTAIYSKLCVLSLIGISVVAPFYLLCTNNAQGMSYPATQPSQKQAAIQWSTFEVPSDIGLPEKREPGGTR